MASRVQSERTTTMLGSEYNWLISLSRPGKGTPRVRMARTGMLTLAVAVFCFFCVALRAGPAHPRSPDEAAARAATILHPRAD